MKTKTLLSLFFTAFSIFVLSGKTAAQTGNQPLTLTADTFQNGEKIQFLNDGWKFHLGDDQAWIDPAFDDANWETLEDTWLKVDELAAQGWRGRGWYRLHFRSDESLNGKSLALAGNQYGASEIYLDGRKLASFGKITDERIVEYQPHKLPVTFSLEQSGEHTLAIRFASETFAAPASFITRRLLGSGMKPGFRFYLKMTESPQEAIAQYENIMNVSTYYFLVGVLFALALLHFLLYLFYRAERANLFYSLFAGAFAGLVALAAISASNHLLVGTIFVLSFFFSLAIASVFIFLLKFLYVGFDYRVGKIFWVLIGLWMIFSVLTSFIDVGSLKAIDWTGIALIVGSILFCLVILIKGLRDKKPGARILLGGVLVLLLAVILMILSVTLESDSLRNVAAFVFALAVPISVSIFLARNFARTNRDLKAQLIQIETLSEQKIEQERRESELRGENERRAKELEEARQLQLSMLPKKLPVISNLEIAAYMKPATEVGGDYYDFHVSDDGTLTVAVGDATGHGLKAGTVVTAIKSLFNNLADASDLSDTLNQMSRSLKRMNLRGLFMALTLIKLKDNHLKICVAGMPSTLVYRQATQTVEEISIRAVPLGSLTNFKYRGQEILLGSGDVVLTMSDGFPEMFDPENEMLGFGKAAEVLQEIANRAPQEIIDRFVEVSSEWAGARPADDDVTFVVLKKI